MLVNYLKKGDLVTPLDCIAFMKDYGVLFKIARVTEVRPDYVELVAEVAFDLFRYKGSFKHFNFDLCCEHREVKKIYGKS